MTLDLRPDLEAIFGVLAAAATVIVRGPAQASPNDGALQGYQAVQQLKEATLLKADVATLPTRSRIVITDGADAGTYSVDELVKEDAEVFVVRIAPVAA
jgi:hypothetical protein